MNGKRIRDFECAACAVRGLRGRPAYQIVGGAPLCRPCFRGEEWSRRRMRERERQRAATERYRRRNYPRHLEARRRYYRQHKKSQNAKRVAWQRRQRALLLTLLAGASPGGLGPSAKTESMSQF